MFSISEIKLNGNVPVYFEYSLLMVFTQTFIFVAIYDKVRLIH